MKKFFLRSLLLWTVCCLWMIGFSSPAPSQIRVVSANPVEAGVHALAEQFERDTGNRVAVEAMGTGGINQLFTSSEPADVIIGTTASVAEGVLAGAVEGSATYVARVGIGIIVRTGAAVPDIGTVNAVRATALAADAVVFNTAGSGRYVESMFDGMGIGDAIGAKSERPPNGPQTMERIINGTGSEIGFGLLSEIKPWETEGVQLVGRLPDALQNYTVYEGVVLARSGDPDVAREFITYLTTDAAREVFASTGVD